MERAELAHISKIGYWVILIEVTDNACRLNRSMQHYLVVYLLAFESPRSLSVVD